MYLYRKFILKDKIVSKRKAYVASISIIEKMEILHDWQIIY